MTSGRISVVCAPEALDLVARERSAFLALYPQAAIEIRAGSSQEAVRALFAAQADLAVITRELDPEERAAAVRGKLELEGYRFARDALVIVVHPSNPVENISVPELRQVYAGELHRWSELAGGGGAIEPVVEPVTSDVTGFFVQDVMAGGPITARVFTENDDSAVVARVARTPGAIGYVTLGGQGRGVRALRVAPVVGLPYRAPDPELVYRGDYPLTRLYNLYVRTAGRPLASGFITFITSRDGQELVHEAGLVPTSVPVRFVRRSPMLGTH